MQSTDPAVSQATDQKAVLSIVVSTRLRCLGGITTSRPDVAYHYTLVEGLTAGEDEKARQGLRAFEKSLREDPQSDFAGALATTLFSWIPGASEQVWAGWENTWKMKMRDKASQLHARLPVPSSIGWQVFSGAEFSELEMRLPSSGKGFILDRHDPPSIKLLDGEIRHTLPWGTPEVQVPFFKASGEAKDEWIMGTLADSLERSDFEDDEMREGQANAGAAA